MRRTFVAALLLGGALLGLAVLGLAVLGGVWAWRQRPLRSCPATSP
jgi:hypothetical protein